MQGCSGPARRRSRPEPLSSCRRSPALGTHPSFLLGDTGLLAGERQAFTLRPLPLYLAQFRHDLLGAEPLPFGHLRLLWSRSTLSINPVPSEPVASPVLVRVYEFAFPQLGDPVGRDRLYQKVRLALIGANLQELKPTASLDPKRTSPSRLVLSPSAALPGYRQ